MKTKCKDCNGEFESFSKLKIHQRYAHGMLKNSRGPTACYICQKVFQRRGTMLTHLTSVHLKMKYPCKICGRLCNSKSNLFHHRKRHEKSVKIISIKKSE